MQKYQKFQARNQEIMYKHYKCKKTTGDIRGFEIGSDCPKTPSGDLECSQGLGNIETALV